MIKANSVLLILLILVHLWIAKPLINQLLSKWKDFGVNSNERVFKNMMEMLQSAKRELILYDDGDAKTEGIYSNTDFINALLSKCAANKNFRVRILFNCFTGNLPIVNAVLKRSDITNIEIKYRVGSRPSDIHFKICDEGMLYYLSNHEQGQQERKFKFIASKHKYLIPAFVKSFVRKFNQDFKKSLNFDEASRKFSTAN